MYPMMNGLKEDVKLTVVVVARNISETGRKRGSGLNKNGNKHLFCKEVH
jgi:hypothetical protein